jgi:NarL family two-component system response regulator LiaR
VSKQTAGDQRAIRVGVADAQTLVRKGICALLAAEPDIEVVGEAGDPVDVRALAGQQRPDVILVDLAMFPADSIEAMEQIAAHSPATRVLVLTASGAEERIFAAIKAGAVGFLLKSCEPGDLVRAVREVQRGGAWLHPAIARRLLGEISHAGRTRASGDTLTEREMDVLRLLARGYSNQQIADQLTICEGTVRVHVSNILSKLHIASRTQAALYALREGLATLEEA